MKISWIEDASKPTFAEEVRDGERKVVSLYPLQTNDGKSYICVTIDSSWLVVCESYFRCEINGERKRMNTAGNVICVRD